MCLGCTSVRSQDNINKVIFTGKRNIKYDGENMIYCLWIEWQIFLFADKINKLPEKNGSSDNQLWIEKYVRRRGCSYLRMGIEKNNIKSVILDWRLRSARPSSKGERSTSISSDGRQLQVTQAKLSAPRVCSLAVALLRKKGPRHRKKICTNTFWLYSY